MDSRSYLYIFFFMLLSLATSTSMEVPIPCSENIPCKTGKYCGLQSYCESCIPCDTFNRQPPASTSKDVEPSCAKSRLECGPCLPGYHQHNTTDGEISTACKVQVDSNNFPDWWISWTHWWSIIGFIWLSLITIYTFWTKFSRFVCCLCRRCRTKRPIQRQVSNNRGNDSERSNVVISPEIIAMLESASRSNTPSTVPRTLKTP